MSKKKVVLGLIVGAVVIGGIFAITGGKSKTDTASASTPTAAAEAEPAPATIGTPVRDGDFEFVVQSVQPGQTKIGGDILNTKAQGEFVVVTIKVTNSSNEAQSFFGSNIKARDAANREFEADSTAAIYLPDSKSLYEKLNPGNSVTGQLVFDVPAGTKLSTLELHDSAFSDGVLVTL